MRIKLWTNCPEEGGARMNYEECEEYLSAHQDEFTVKQLGNIIGIMDALIEVNQETKNIVCNHICDMKLESISETEQAKFDGKNAAYNACRNAIMDLYTDYINEICLDLEGKRGMFSGKKKPRRKHKTLLYL